MFSAANVLYYTVMCIIIDEDFLQIVVLMKCSRSSANNNHTF